MEAATEEGVDFISRDLDRLKSKLTTDAESDSRGSGSGGEHGDPDFALPYGSDGDVDVLADIRLVQSLDSLSKADRVRIVTFY